MSKNFIYGIASVKFGEALVGYIEKGSWDWGGQKPESVDIEAEQVPDAPVLTLLQKNGTVSPTFNLIQLDYKNLKAVLGGKLSPNDETPHLVGGSGGTDSAFGQVGNQVYERSDYDDTQRCDSGQSGRQADADGSVEGGMPAED